MVRGYCITANAFWPYRRYEISEYLIESGALNPLDEFSKFNPSSKAAWLPFKRAYVAVRLKNGALDLVGSANVDGGRLAYGSVIYGAVCFINVELPKRERELLLAECLLRSHLSVNDPSVSGVPIVGLRSELIGEGISAASGARLKASFSKLIQLCP